MRSAVGALRRVPEHLGEVLVLEGHLPQPLRRGGGHVRRVAAADLRGHVEAPPDAVVRDDRRRRRDVDRRHVTEAHRLTARRVHQHLLHLLDAGARLRAAPHDDVEDRLLLVQAAHGQPRDQRADLAPHVTRPEPVALRRRQVHLHRHRRLAHQRLDLGRDDALDRLQRLRDVLGGRLEGRVVLTGDPHDELVAGRGTDRGHPVVGVGPDRAAQARIAGDRRPDAVERLVVVGVVGDGEPDLAGIDVDDLVGTDRPADVRADRRDAGQLPQFRGRDAGDAVHLGQRRARGRLEPDEHVAVLEAGQERTGAQARQTGQDEAHEDDEAEDGRHHAPDRAARHPVVALAAPSR